MKKILIIAASVLCSVAVYVEVNSYNNNSQSDLMTKNLEALTQGESGGSGCTGPKTQIFKVVCRCENSMPCRDSYGCN